MVWSGPGPLARTSSYAVVDGRTYLLRLSPDGTGPVLLAPPDAPRPAGFEADPDAPGWVRPVTWHDVERAFEVEVWWRAANDAPVLESARDDGRVLGVPKGGGAAWYDVETLSHRSEVEHEYDVAALRRLAHAPAPLPVTRRTVRSTTADGTPVGRPLVTRHVRGPAVPQWVVPALLVAGLALLVVGVLVVKELIVVGTAVLVVAVLAQARSLRPGGSPGDAR